MFDLASFETRTVLQLYMQYHQEIDNEYTKTKLLFGEYKQQLLEIEILSQILKAKYS